LFPKHKTNTFANEIRASNVTVMCSNLIQDPSTDAAKFSAIVRHMTASLNKALLFCELYF